MRAVLFGLRQELLFAPLGVSVWGGQVLLERGKSVANPGALVTGDALAADKDLDGGLGEIDLDRIADVGGGDTVAVGGHHDMIVEIDTCFAPHALSEGVSRKRTQSGAVEGLEERGARTSQALGFLVIVRFEKRGQRLVQLGEAVERVVAQRRQKPTL